MPGSGVTVMRPASRSIDATTSDVAGSSTSPRAVDHVDVGAARGQHLDHPAQILPLRRPHLQPHELVVVVRAFGQCGRLGRGHLQQCAPQGLRRLRRVHAVQLQHQVARGVHHGATPVLAVTDEEACAAAEPIGEVGQGLHLHLAPGAPRTHNAADDEAFGRRWALRWGVVVLAGHRPGRG